MNAAKKQEEERKAAAAAQRAADERVPASARQRWELENNVQVTSDAFWAPDPVHMAETRRTKPWRTEMRYFTSVKISALAAVKMFIHAKRGSPDLKVGRQEWFEVMGLLMGHYKGEEMIVTDSFGLPVDASEVECSMNETSQIYMVEYLDYHRRVGKADRGCIGWYHSHPGYTCFLSGIDVNTQQLNQKAQDPWVAVVVDPVHTVSTGKLDVKAFRTFPEEYAIKQLKESGGGGGATRLEVPSSRVKEYGVHAHRYYELPVTIVRSTTDAKQLNALLGQYWSLAFSTNPLLANRGFNTTQMHRVVDALGECKPSNSTGRGRTRGARGQAFAVPVTEEETTVKAVDPVFERDNVPFRVARSGGDVARGEEDAEKEEEEEKKDQQQQQQQEEESAQTEKLKSSAPAAYAQYYMTDLATEMLFSGTQLSMKELVFYNQPL